MLVLAVGMVYLMPPAELLAVLPELPAVTMRSAFFNGLIRAFIYLSKPLLWPSYLRLLAGVGVALGSWAVVFFGLMALTVRQSRKGFRVEIVTGSRKIRSKA